MLNTDFDALVRSCRGHSRRSTLRLLTLTLLTGVITPGALHEADARRKKHKKKKKVNGVAPPCVPRCTGKRCGADGCGGSCGSCGAGEACQGGRCVSTNCSPPCPANQVCQNGSCGCPPGTKTCPSQGPDGSCHECCVNGGGSAPDPECNGNANGNYCTDHDGDQIYICGCYVGTRNCGDGVCVTCCETQHCSQVSFPEHRVCAAGQCLCDTENGFFECPAGSFHSRECRYINEDSDACGINCDRCDPPRSICQARKCCIPSGQSCSGATTSCCSGESACQPGFICS